MTANSGKNVREAASSEPPTVITEKKRKINESEDKLDQSRRLQ